MKRHYGFAMALVLFATLLVFAQRPEEHSGQSQRPAEPQRSVEPQRPVAQPNAERGEGAPRANRGRVPAAPPQRDPHAPPEVEQFGSRSDSVPHVANDHWYGHDRPDDKRYHIDHPFEHGHFDHFGPDYRYDILREDFEHRRIWFVDGSLFEVSSWDWPICQNWCWSCGNDFIVYDDPDHPGWYLLYNIHTGQYVHALFMGT